MKAYWKNQECVAYEFITIVLTINQVQFVLNQVAICHYELWAISFISLDHSKSPMAKLHQIVSANNLQEIWQSWNSQNIWNSYYK